MYRKKRKPRLAEIRLRKGSQLPAAQHARLSSSSQSLLKSSARFANNSERADSEPAMTGLAKRWAAAQDKTRSRKDNVFNRYIMGWWLMLLLATE